MGFDTIGDPTMSTFLSPGVYPREIDLSNVPSAVGDLTPAFIGTANKGPFQKPTYITNSQQFIDVFGKPFPESFLGYAALAHFESGNKAWITRVGIECEEGQPDALSNICIDNSGAREKGWGRISIFSGIDYGKICTRIINADTPLTFHNALTSDIDYNDSETDPTYGITSATLAFTDLNGYVGPIDDSYTLIITSDVPASNSSLMDGATYEIIRNSDGMVVLTGTINESGVPKTSEIIDPGDGLSFRIVITGISPIGVNDTFTFVVRPDNRKFSFGIDHQDAGTINQYTMPSNTYTTASDFADAINALVPTNEDYRAIAQTDDTVCFRTDVAGEMIQLVGTEAFSLEVGQVLYAYDIPRSNLISTNTEPYDITNENNRINIQIVDVSETSEMEFTIPVGLNQSAAIVAANIHLGGIHEGDRKFQAFTITTPGGETQIVIETITAHQFGQIQMQADGSHWKTLRFAEELGILYPYKEAYRTFNDLRVTLPTPGSTTYAVPLSCETNPASDECAADSAYFASIVGWIVAKTAGTWTDEYQVTLSIFSAGEAEGDVSGRFVITIEDTNGQTVERIEDVNFDPTSTRYIGNVINEGGAIAGPTGNAFIQWIPRPSFLANDPEDSTNFEVRIPGSFNRKAFTGQANGIPTDPSYSSELDRAVIGNPSLSTGIYSLSNPEVFDISLLATPGFTSGSVIGQALQLCENRGDCLYLVDSPFGLRAQQVVDWHNGILFSDLANSINSSYGSLYHPWLKIFDQFNGGSIYVPPSGHVSSVYAKTAEIAETWFAPAGINRGRLLTPLDTEINLTNGERDLMYGSGNAVNPIVNFPQDGITVFGQRTLKRTASALDRVNVRMLLIYIKKSAINFLRQYIFEPNDEITRLLVTNISNSFLSEIMGRRGLTGYNVVCDSRNNTPERIDRNELHVAYFLKPTRTAEFIQLNLVILRTEAGFSAEQILQAGGVVA